MNLRTIKRNQEVFDPAEIAAVGGRLNLHPRLTELLFSRGLRDETAIRRFLTPDPDNLDDPFLMKGMKAAADRLHRAVEHGEKVVVYGDYDADGICATAILTLYLSSCGLDVYAHIPNRIGEGYGLNIESIEHIIEEACPDLILTCDCGISGYAEVEHALDLGVDMIVTDHHELAERLPECIVVNPKQTDCGYPINYLCGAGVALKLVEAMGGRDAIADYLDLAAIATIADLVPLLDENRLIVQLGLRAIAARRNKGLRYLLDTLGLSGSVTSGDIAYKVAPRINAAGRMGDAYRAFELLTSGDDARLYEIIGQINDDNTRRKDVCDELYTEAVGDLLYEDMVHDRAIVLSHPSWEKGITGIVAARLAGDFRRPSFILVHSGDGTYKGTCRSVDGINIHELLSDCADLLLEYGGHAQAAGFSIAEENIPAFKTRVNEYLRRFPDEYFLPQIKYDLDIDEADVTLDFASALDMLEPTGNSFSKPLFKTETGRLSVSCCKSNANHTSITTEHGLQILAFNFFRQNSMLMGDGRKSMILEIQANEFGGRKSVKSVLRAVCPETLYVDDALARVNYVKHLNMLSFAPGRYKTYTELKPLLDGNIYGTLLIAADSASYARALSDAESGGVTVAEFMYAHTKNNFSRILVSPEFDDGLLLHAYEKVIFLDTPVCDGVIGYINKHSKAAVYVPAADTRARFTAGLSTDRAVFGKCFEALRRARNVTAASLYSFIRKLNLPDKIAPEQFAFCLCVFAELGFVTAGGQDRFACTINPSVKRDLSESAIYRYIAAVPV